MLQCLHYCRKLCYINYGLFSSSKLLLTSQHEKTISVPTEKLLEEHNKLLKEKSTDGKKQNSDSEDSMSPEEMRKQLLLSRAKKKLENSKLAERMKSNSPDVLILDETSRTASKDFGQSSRYIEFLVDLCFVFTLFSICSIS